jgi:hypothetical protein
VAVVPVVLAVLVAASASAETESTPARVLSFGTGWFDCVQKRDPAVQALVEYRAGRATHPLRAVFVASTTRDSSTFVGAGIGYELAFARHWVLMPTFVPGYYRQGSGKDLGYPLEFRSQLELGYRFGSGERLSIAFAHVSNGSLGDINPGQESLTLAWQMPLGRRQGR